MKRRIDNRAVIAQDLQDIPAGGRVCEPETYVPACNVTPGICTGLLKVKYASLSYVWAFASAAHHSDQCRGNHAQDIVLSYSPPNLLRRTPFFVLRNTTRFREIPMHFSCLGTRPRKTGNTAIGNRS